MKLVTKKNIALGLLAIPIAFLIFFAIGEGLDPEFGISGFLLHTLQALPLIFLFWFCSKWPILGGRVLIALSVVTAPVFLFFGNGPIAIRFIPVLILFAIPVISGVLLLKD